jgi:hypothetical protein
MRRLRGDAGNQGSASEEMPDLQEQGRAADFARVVHPEGQRMVRDGLREEEHAEQHRIGFFVIGSDTSEQRQHDIVGLVIKGSQRIEAGNGIEVVVI